MRIDQFVRKVIHTRIYAAEVDLTGRSLLSHLIFSDESKLYLEIKVVCYSAREGYVDNLITGLQGYYSS